jgi:penicillin-binding protein 1A
MLRFAFYSLLGLVSAGLIAVGAIYWALVPDLPSIEALKDVRLQVPLRVYTADGKLIAEYGEMRRAPVTYAETPPLLVKAFLAAEDDRFYDHPGVDWQAILRAALHLIRTGEKTQGGSTITMQVARNFFLTREKTYLRKLNEILLALKIERELDKNAILELYLNKIYLGQRAYGVGAAAQVYYGSTLAELDLAELAMIAGLPKAPSKANPVSNPQRALERRNYVLGRMLEQRLIERSDYETAVRAPVTARLHGQPIEAEAPYVGEMVRSHLYDKYGENAYTSGLQVFTTVNSRLQEAANRALREALLDYDRRHGYRGPERHFELPADSGESEWDELLKGFDPVGGLIPALVIATDDEAAQLYANGLGVVRISNRELRWARPYLNSNARGPAPKAPSEVLAVGDVVRIRSIMVEPERAAEVGAGESEGAATAVPVWALSQLPAVEGALVSMSPIDGSILALAGGFDFAKSKFNRVMQARRQPGSNFKPFIYAAALDAGETAATMINDAPIVFDAPGLESIWRPENYSGKYYGPTRLREALANSRNLVSIRLLRRIGVDYALEYLPRFGFEPGRLPPNLSLSLGSGELAPIEVIRAYAVFANGGFLIEPYYIQRIMTDGGALVMEAEPRRACPDCLDQLPAPTGEPDTIEELQALAEVGPGTGPADAASYRAGLAVAPRAVSAETAFILNSMLGDVIRRGTGRRALSLGRQDLAGKTGTTNDQKDAWFSGFNANVLTTTWVGFDESLPLGRLETGAQAALPMWIEFMKVALAGQPESRPEQPPGLVSVRIDPGTGCLTGARTPGAIFEYFRADRLPCSDLVGPVNTDVPEQLF